MTEHEAKANRVFKWFKAFSLECGSKDDTLAVVREDASLLVDTIEALSAMLEDLKTDANEYTVYAQGVDDGKRMVLSEDIAGTILFCVQSAESVGLVRKSRAEQVVRAIAALFPDIRPGGKA